MAITQATFSSGVDRLDPFWFIAVVVDFTRKAPPGLDIGIIASFPWHRQLPPQLPPRLMSVATSTNNAFPIHSLINV